MKFKPLHDRILIEVDADESETKGGLLMPEGSIEDIHKMGTVVAVGPGRVTKKGVRIPVDVSVGDRVWFVRFLERTETGKALHATLGPHRFLIQEQDIVAIRDEDQG